APPPGGGGAENLLGNARHLQLLGDARLLQLPGVSSYSETPSFSRMSWRARAASALPRLAFITPPTSAPTAAILPERTLSAASAFFASTSSIIAASSPSSLTIFRPRLSTTSSGVPSPASTPSSTSRASLSLSSRSEERRVGKE